MSIEWTRSKTRYEYYNGNTGTPFSAQVGQSSNVGKYVWMIFHDDFRYCVFGAEVETLDDAKQQSADWLDANAKPYNTSA